MSRSEVRYGMVGLFLATLACAALMSFVGQAPRVALSRSDGPVPNVIPSNAIVAPGAKVRFRSSAGGALLLATKADGPWRTMGDEVEIEAVPDRAAAERMLAVPLSLNWKHPLCGLPVAEVFRVAELDPMNRPGPVRMHTVLFEDHGELPVLSLAITEGALFDPDTGLMVVGNGIFRAPEKVLVAEYRDPKSWKYPGNFHMRGKEWQREARIQLIAADGSEEFQTAVGVRINGQMTRSFPQHALRLVFEDPLQADIFNEAVGDGYDALVLRTAGNDQIKAMLRDPFLHGLIEGLPLEVSKARPCVLYINGAYWGVHYLRHRLDDDEMARRYGIKKKYITILEDEARFYRGDPDQVPAFERMALRTAAWNGKGNAWTDTLEAQLDVDGFFVYMATQMILGNVDWPSQNVKFWKYTGPPEQRAPLTDDGASSWAIPTWHSGPMPIRRPTCSPG
ncbi:MAG: CotH kinase family protein [Flavobacteriales bacterium]